MKKSTFSLFILILLLNVFQAKGQLALYEDFNYTPPANIGGAGTGTTNNNWTTHSGGTSGTIDVASGNLSYTGLPAPTGYKIFSDGNTISRDVNRPLTYTNTVIYFSALINIVDNTHMSATGDYFFHLGATTGATVTIFGARTGAKTVNAGANYRFIILNTSGGTTVFTEFPQDMNFGTTYLVVVKYDRSTSPTTATIWVNPATLGGPDPTGGAVNTSGTGTFNSFASICLRNGTSTPKFEIDEIRVGAAYADVTPLGVTNPPVVTTSPVINITHNTATAGGNVTSDGGSPITARGVCWSTTANPTVSDLHTTETGTTGAFTSNITGLSPQTTYHTRAYATNLNGTTYGADEPFTTLCEPFAPVTDFTASATVINVGDSIDFFDMSTYCPTSWNWSFVGGEPMSSNLQNPTSIHFNYPGTFHVCLTTTNSYGQTVKCISDYITVIGPPVPADVNLVLTEIMYNSPESGADSLEFLELYNNGDNAANLEDFVITNGVDFTFPDVTVNPGSYLVVAKDSAAMRRTFGVSSLQWDGGSLANSGELVKIVDYNGFTVDSVYYDDVLPWDTLANGYGMSLEFCEPDSNNALPENWRHALEYVTVNASGDSIWASPGTGCKYPPSADFSASSNTIVEGESVTFTDLSTGTVTAWEWTFDGGYPSTSTLQTPPAVVYSTAGSYSVSLKVTNADGTSIKTRVDYILVGPTGTDDLSSGRLTIFPNPANGKFSVTYTRSNFRAQIYSVTGEMIAEEVTSSGKTDFNISEMPQGIYLVKITDDSEQVITRKLIIQ